MLKYIEFFAQADVNALISISLIIFFQKIFLKILWIF